MLNRIIVMGRLTREPELKYTQSGVAVCTITLACERDYAAQGAQREADFIDVVNWRQGAEFVSRYFHKGQLVACEGRLTSRRWTDNSGSNRISWEIVADRCYFAERMQSAQSAAPSGGPSSAAPGGSAGYDAAMQAAQSAGVPYIPMEDDGLDIFADDDVPY